MTTPTPFGRILPLHLSILEKFFLLEDRPGFPMTFVIQLTLGGQVDRTAWEGALEKALAFQPLLTANIGQGKGNRVCWLPARQPIPTCDWGPADQPITCPGSSEGIDLTRETGLRVWVRQGSERAVVTLQFHHACTDGIGAYRFLGELLAAYGILTEGPARHTLSDLDACLLRGRQRRALGREVPFGLRTAWRALRYGCGLYRRRPAPLALPSGGNSQPGLAGSSFPGYCTISFDQATHHCLREVATQKGVMLNDLLLRDLFLTLRQWNRPRFWWLEHPRLRVMMPTDLRDMEDFAMPAANMVGYSFLSRTIRDCATPDALLHGIGAETVRIKQQRSGADFLETILAADFCPGLLSFVLPTRWSLCTAVLSNVGDPSRRFIAKLPRKGGRVHAGNLVLEDITGVPPYRPRTRATVSIFQYDRRLTLCLRCDPQLYRMADSEQLLKLYADQLQTSAREWRPATTAVGASSDGETRPGDRAHTP